MCVLPSVYEQDCVMAWQCVSIAILITVTPRTLPSLHVLYWTDRNRSRVTKRFVPASIHKNSTNESQSGSTKNCSSSNDRFPHRLFSPSFIYRLCLLKVSTRPRTSTSMFQFFSGVKLVSAAQSISNF